MVATAFRKAVMGERRDTGYNALPSRFLESILGSVGHDETSPNTTSTRKPSAFLEGVLKGVSGDSPTSSPTYGSGTYGQNIWGDAKAPAQVEGLGIGEDMESGDTDTGRRKRRGTKTSAGLGI